MSSGTTSAYDRDAVKHNDKMDKINRAIELRLDNNEFFGLVGVTKYRAECGGLCMAEKCLPEKCPVIPEFKQYLESVCPGKEISVRFTGTEFDTPLFNATAKERSAKSIINGFGAHLESVIQRQRW